MVGASGSRLGVGFGAGLGLAVGLLLGLGSWVAGARLGLSDGSIHWVPVPLHAANSVATATARAKNPPCRAAVFTSHTLPAAPPQPAATGHFYPGGCGLPMRAAQALPGSLNGQPMHLGGGVHQCGATGDWFCVSHCRLLGNSHPSCNDFNRKADVWNAVWYQTVAGTKLDHTFFIIGP